MKDIAIIISNIWHLHTFSGLVSRCRSNVDFRDSTILDIPCCDTSSFLSSNLLSDFFESAHLLNVNCVEIKKINFELLISYVCISAKLLGVYIIYFDFEFHLMIWSQLVLGLKIIAEQRLYFPSRVSISSPYSWKIISWFNRATSWFFQSYSYNKTEM